MKFVFVGDPARNGQGPDAITLFGHTFPKGVGVEVADEKVVRKLAGNGHFRAVEEGPAEVPAASEPEWTKDSLEAYVRDKHGVEIDKRKSLARLIEEVKALDDGLHQG